MSVQSLRQAGNKVRVTHLRNVKVSTNVAPGVVLENVVTLSLFDARNLVNAGKLNGFNAVILPRGGATQVEISTNDGKNHVGVSKCHLNDNFCRSEGVEKALERIVL
jgi:hypothetical protein